MRVIRILVAISTAFILSAGIMSAQKKAVGLTFAFNGFGLSYEHNVESGNFITIDLEMDTDDYMWNRAANTGIRADIIWNMVFAEKTSSLGNKVAFFAGPGVMAGYVTDLGPVPGAAFGLMGRVGMECRFKRPIILSACLSPIIGSHITYKDGDVKMKLYKSGLMQLVIPEIGIKYAF